MRSSRFFQLPGVSFPAISMPGSFIRGIEIDNSSGSWLFIPSLETYVPPFTIGWAFALPYGASSVDIVAGLNGPAGQISTTQGSGVTVYLNDADISASSGSADPSAPTTSAPVTGVPFIEGFTPVISAGISAAVEYGFGLSTVLVAAVPLKRIRLLTLTAVLGGFPASPALIFDSGVTWEVKDGSSVVDLLGHLLLDSPVDHRVFPLGLDVPVGQGLQVIASSDFADSFMTLRITYQLI